MITLQERIEHLARCRQIKAEFRQEVADVEAEIAFSGLGRVLAERKEYLATARAEVTDAEEVVRQTALQAYEQTGEKRPHPAVLVKARTVLAYDPGDALEYAREHLPQALKLDRRTFERVAKAAGLEFVSVGQEMRPTIARDLSEWLTPAQEAA